MDVIRDAGFVSVSEIDDVLVIGFADREFDTSAYLMLQRSLDLGDDEGVHLEIDDQGRSCYGDVSACTLTRDEMSLVLAAPLARALEAPLAFAVRFSCPDATFEALGAGLRRLFADTGCVLNF